MLSAQKDLSINTQVYPTKIIPGLLMDHVIGSKQAQLFRFGYQFIDHRNLGIHDNEEGSVYDFTSGNKTI